LKRGGKNKESQRLLSQSTYNEFKKETAISAGFSHKTGTYDVENDAFPQGMIKLKQQHKQSF